MMKWKSDSHINYTHTKTHMTTQSKITKSFIPYQRQIEEIKKEKKKKKEKRKKKKKYPQRLTGDTLLEKEEEEEKERKNQPLQEI